MWAIQTQRILGSSQLGIDHESCFVIQRHPNASRIKIQDGMQCELQWDICHVWCNRENIKLNSIFHKPLWSRQPQSTGLGCAITSYDHIQRIHHSFRQQNSYQGCVCAPGVPLDGSDYCRDLPLNNVDIFVHHVEIWQREREIYIYIYIWDRQTDRARGKLFWNG